MRIKYLTAFTLEHLKKLVSQWSKENAIAYGHVRYRTDRYGHSVAEIYYLEKGEE